PDPAGTARSECALSTRPRQVAVRRAWLQPHPEHPPSLSRRLSAPACVSLAFFRRTHRSSDRSTHAWWSPDACRRSQQQRAASTSPELSDRVSCCLATAIARASPCGVLVVFLVPLRQRAV